MSTIEIKGILRTKCDLRTGTSSRGEWKSRDIIVEERDDDGFPLYICLNAWGDMVDRLDDLNEGEGVAANVRLSSREWNGRWYTEARIIDITSDLPF